MFKQRMREVWMDEMGNLGPTHPENLPEGRVKGAESSGKEPLRHARSKAELTRVRQGWVMICIQSTSLIMTILILLKTFGII